MSRTKLDDSEVEMIGAGDAAEHARDDHRAVAQRRHRDAGRVDRLRVLAHGAEPQAEAGAGQRPGGERHQQEGDIGEDRVRQEDLGEEAEDGHVRQRGDARNLDGQEASLRRQRRACGRLP